MLQKSKSVWKLCRQTFIFTLSFHQLESFNITDNDNDNDDEEDEDDDEEEDEDDEGGYGDVDDEEIDESDDDKSFNGSAEQDEEEIDDVEDVLDPVIRFTVFLIFRFLKKTAFELWMSCDQAMW